MSCLHREHMCSTYFISFNIVHGFLEKTYTGKGWLAGKGVFLRIEQILSLESMPYTCTQNFRLNFSREELYHYQVFNELHLGKKHTE